MSCLEKDKRFHEDKCSAADDDTDLSEYKKTDRSRMGLTGLQNLGNTCFMNSGIQCLSNTFVLSRHFLDDSYLNEINEENPLGMKGLLARSYARLVKTLWYSAETEMSPTSFKKTIGKFRSIFKSYAQQDSQELITATLDALHEDLNRIKKKPYVECKTTDDPNNNDISVDSWYGYLARNQSIILDLMHGQYKSIVKCPTCQKYSVIFDPFSTVTLPIPSLKERSIQFFYVPYDTGKKIIKSKLTIKQGDTIDRKSVV